MFTRHYNINYGILYSLLYFFLLKFFVLVELGQNLLGVFILVSLELVWGQVFLQRYFISEIYFVEFIGNESIDVIMVELLFRVYLLDFILLMQKVYFFVACDSVFEDGAGVGYFFLKILFEFVEVVCCCGLLKVLIILNSWKLKSDFRSRLSIISALILIQREFWCAYVWTIGGKIFSIGIYIIVSLISLINIWCFVII